VTVTGRSVPPSVIDTFAPDKLMLSLCSVHPVESREDQLTETASNGKSPGGGHAVQAFEPPPLPPMTHMHE